jgi:hypothetical protein
MSDNETAQDAKTLGFSEGEGYDETEDSSEELEDEELEDDEEDEDNVAVRQAWGEQ